MTSPQVEDNESSTSNTSARRAHNDEVNPSDAGGQRRPKRAQVSRACQRCRRLQKACNEYRPCQRCSRAGLAEQCIGGGVPMSVLGATNHTLLPTIITTSSAAATAGSPGLDSAASSSSPRQAFTSTGSTQHTYLRRADLLPPHVIEHCSARFFERLFPTIPILVPEYVQSLQSRSIGLITTPASTGSRYGTGTVKESSSSDAAEAAASEAYCLLFGLCAMVMLQVEDASGLTFANLPIKLLSSAPFSHNPVTDNRTYGWLLLEEALALHRHLTATRRSSTISPSLEHVQLSFFIYACHAALMHHSQAFFFLREATTLCLLLRREDMPPDRALLADRLFWVLVVSERSHAIRYRRPTTLQITPSSPSLLSLFKSSASASGDDGRDANDPAIVGFRCLAGLFGPLDTFFIALHGQEEIIGFALLPPEALDGVEAGIDAALGGSGDPALSRLVHGLQDTQKANLRVTQAWLRIILWQLRLRLGHLTTDERTIAVTAAVSPTAHHPYQQNSIHSIMNHDDEVNTSAGATAASVTNLPTTSTAGVGGGNSSRTYRYPLAVARDLALSTRGLPLAAIAVHGAGLTEKLFDVACAVVNVLARVPVVDVNTSAAAKADFAYLRDLIARLPGGTAVYAGLLEKHVRTTMPGVGVGVCVGDLE
ncbi:hypothetical protein DL766_002759 [Monosporascus sp. MC13-8B]|uniref:Zn(2)-C6 fungal-type domain-containing protein n=1 Tax=Monosporascus cannonballus TaxID=155416 RepID=A0ABY0HNF7_9PEZI|nr:hypothetical protein DL762_000294 [Monosporascus cannonballus]RYP34918.1 hypothetical protein DL766_002759 [Monosporascus sp. MC13-8B]